MTFLKNKMKFSLVFILILISHISCHSFNRYDMGEIYNIKRSDYNLESTKYDLFRDINDFLPIQQDDSSELYEHDVNNKINNDLRDEELETHSSLIAGHQYVSGNDKNY